MSPAGDKLRIRSRNFPGLVSSTSIDWFFSWPSKALESVAVYYLQDVEIESEEMRTKIVTHFVFTHQQIPVFSKDYEMVTKRKNYSTPKNYLDFLNSYKVLLRDNRTRINDTIVRYSDGLKKLDESKRLIEGLQKEITIEKAKANVEKEEVEILITNINEKKEIVGVKAEDARVKKEKLDIDNAEINHQQQEADAILKEAEPALVAAQKTVETIQKKDLDYIKALANPNPLIQSTMQCLQALRVNENANENDGWAGAKAMLTDMKLKERLIEFGAKIGTVKHSQYNFIKDKKKKIEEELQRKEKTMSDVSPACETLLCWVGSVIVYYETNRKVEPLKANVKVLEAKLTELTIELKHTEKLVMELNAELEDLNAKFTLKKGQLDELIAKVEGMERKLNAATKLIDGLGSEQKRWTEGQVELREKYTFMDGECLLCASFLSYFGPFDQVFRRKITEALYLDISENAIKVGEKFSVESLLTDDVQKSGWNSEGLPEDELSVQNGILTTQASRYPLCIDPQLQAIVWIKKRDEKEIKVVSFNDDTFARTVEMCIKFGKPVLIENIDEELDPLIDPLLEKNYIIKGGRKMVKLGSEEIEINEKDFRMYLTTKLPNPGYTPEVMGKCSVINYTVTLNGLKDQLLNEVVGFENEEKERQRKQLIMDMSDNKKVLQELEDKLLKDLAETKGSLLDNEDLIATLDETKQKTLFINDALIEGEKTRELIEEARQSYSDVAKRGAILFFSMRSLSAISDMYEYSLSSYLLVYRTSLKEARADTILMNRINNIIDKLTHNIFDYTCLGIFERHKLMFSLQMTINIIGGDGGLNEAEWEFFMKGNTSLDPVKATKPHKWITESGWKDIEQLVTIGEAFNTLQVDLENNADDWKAWYDTENPEDEPLPAPYNDKIKSKFQLLLI